jgi:hypothetical protein
VIINREREPMCGKQWLVFMMLFGVTTAVCADEYARWFVEQTMRVDYYHTGTKGEERFSLDRVYEEGPWPGSRTQLLDTLNLGEFLVRVSDRTTNTVIYSRGFSSIFNEWQTTDEAAGGAFRTFEETVRFPYPRRAVQVTVARRDRRMVFHELFSTIIDPADPTAVEKERRPSPLAVTPLMNNGAPAEKVDILILGDGYAKADQEKFRKDAAHFNMVMFTTRPFAQRKKDFNVWMIEVPSEDSGIDIPDKNVWKRNALGTMYNTFGSARYVLTTHNRALRDIAAAAPYDFICILINDTRYGGGGIYNLYATTYTKEQVAGQEWQMDYVYVHEFGHSFGGLGDEYYSSSTAYNEFYPPGVEPWEPNVTALQDRGNVKWKSLLAPGVPVPTRWEKTAYDSIEALRGKLDRLAPDYYTKREPLHKASMEILKNSPLAGKVGAFEGAGYASTGLYRPAIDCRMFSLSTGDFDPVCSAAIERVIDCYTR